MSSITLGDLDAVDNSVLFIIGRIYSVSEVKLVNLKNVNSTGVRGVINLKEHRLTKLTVGGCRDVTDKCIEFAKKVVKEVVYCKNK